MNHAVDNQDSRRANRRTGLRLIGLTLAMFGMAFALVPLYDVFCRITGLNGKTGRVDAASVGPPSLASRPIRVEFVANINHGLALEFEPLTSSMTVDTGNIREVRYRVINPTDRPVAARAVPSVAPARAAAYFNKVECFCFNRQRVAAGATVEMPARFVVDPELPDSVRVITLSYTFFAQSGDDAGGGDAGDAAPGDIDAIGVEATRDPAILALHEDRQ